MREIPWFLWYIKHMLNMLGVNISITAIHERVLYCYFTYPENW